MSAQAKFRAMTLLSLRTGGRRLGPAGEGGAQAGRRPWGGAGMRPSDEKLRAVVHAATRAVEASPQVTVRDVQDVRDALRLAVAEVMELHQKIHDVSQAQAEPMIEPHSMAYSFGWKAITMVR